MQKRTRFAAAITIGALTTALAVAAGNAFVTINGTAVAQSTADFFIGEQKAKGAPDSPELKKAVREELIRRELLTQEAKKAGLDKKPDVALQADLARQAIYIRAYIQDYLKKNPISDAQIRAQYETVKTQMGGTEYKLRHILVANEDDAKAIIANLKKGAKFEELARQSIDPGSKEKGGELGWSSAGNFVKPFAEALTGLTKGKYTETPVKTEFGYHVIELEDTRPLNTPSFDEMKPRLTQQMQGQQINKLLEGLRAKAKID